MLLGAIPSKLTPDKVRPEGVSKNVNPPDGAIPSKVIFTGLLTAASQAVRLVNKPNCLGGRWKRPCPLTVRFESSLLAKRSPFRYEIHKLKF